VVWFVLINIFIRITLLDTINAYVLRIIEIKICILFQECKKVLTKSRSNVLTEEIMKQVCTEYFSVFHGNKLWPLFCLKPDDNDSNDSDEHVWMRKHNNVNLVGWLKHPMFRNPSYIKKRKINSFCYDYFYNANNFICFFYVLINSNYINNIM